jgi:hypothetical protein
MLVESRFRLPSQKPENGFVPVSRILRDAVGSRACEAEARSPRDEVTRHGLPIPAEIQPHVGAGLQVIRLTDHSGLMALMLLPPANRSKSCVTTTTLRKCPASNSPTTI